MTVASVKKSRARVAGVDLAKLSGLVRAEGGDWRSPASAASMIGLCQSVPTVSRQIVALWAQRHGINGEAYMWVRTWAREKAHLEVSMPWLIRFLNRTRRGSFGEAIDGPAA